MSQPQSLAKRLVFATVGSRVGTYLGRTARDAWSSLSYRSDPRGRQSAARLRLLRNRYAGRRCFIIGNGPSLQGMDLDPLRSELTFGLNRAYLMFEKLGFATTFLVSVNRLVIEQSGSEILAAPVDDVFLSWSARDATTLSDRPMYLRSLAHPGFSTDSSLGVWEGATVTYVAMQLAYHMGIRDVVLVGVDHSFDTAGPPHQIVTSSGPDRDHFDPHYFGPGYRWQLPDLVTSEFAYELARRAFESVGGRIRDATVGGRLSVFPKVQIENVFSAEDELR